MPSEAEEWRPVAGYEGFYTVSDRGNVRGYRYDRNLSLLGTGRKHVFLYKPGGERVKRLVHRLVAEAFISNPEGHPIVRHLNDDPADNRVENLAWGTHTQNMQDALRNGRNFQRSKTECPRGHQYTEANIYWSGGHRKCRTCCLKRIRDVRLAQREMKLAEKEGA